jgi:hypothetical protein
MNLITLALRPVVADRTFQRLPSLAYKKSDSSRMKLQSCDSWTRPVKRFSLAGLCL